MESAARDGVRAGKTGAMTRDQRKAEERERGGNGSGGEDRRREGRRDEWSRLSLFSLSPGSKCGVLARVSWLIARGAATGLVWILSYSNRGCFCKLFLGCLPAFQVSQILVQGLICEYRTVRRMHPRKYSGSPVTAEAHVT